MPSRNIPHRAIARMVDTRWAIREDKLEMMLQIANRQDLDINGLKALADKMPQYKETDDDYLFTRNGSVAIIDVVGPCFRYSNLMTMFCGASSYDSIARARRAAMDDKTIEAIIYNHDSPGGEVTSCGELAAAIYEDRGRKPQIAYVDGDSCSASYWLAAACDHIVASPTSVIGCLGVVGIWGDRSEADKKEGVKKFEIVSTLTPNKRPDPASDDGRAQLLRMIDATAEVFLGDVGLYRGIDGGAEAVAKQFGGGDVYVGKHAVAVGLADEIGTFESLLAMLGTDAEAA